MTLPVAFPAASWTSNSRSPIAIPGGTTNWLPAWTPFGAIHGSSQGSAYLNLRPAANNSFSPSTTTYVFATPTPPAGWGFVLGDIDADMVVVSATDAAGSPVSSAGLGLQAVFNYCDGSPRPSSCTNPPPGTLFDVPTATLGVTSVSIVGNVADTNGAAASFQPTVPLSTLTFVYIWQAGFPVYHTWFASLTRFISGTVTVDGSPGLGGVEMTLTDSQGAVVATTVTAPDGTYSFDGLGPADGYTVTMTTPDGYQPVGPESLVVDLSSDKATEVDFDLTLIPDTGSITVDLVVEDDPPADDWEVTVDSSNCELAPGPITATIPAAGGTEVFSNLPIESAGDLCSYDVTQPPREGWVTPGATVIALDPEPEAQVTITNALAQPTTTTTSPTTTTFPTTTTAPAVTTTSLPTTTVPSVTTTSIVAASTTTSWTLPATGGSAGVSPPAALTVLAVALGGILFALIRTRRSS
jgi:SdrD B-like domain